MSSPLSTVTRRLTAALVAAALVPVAASAATAPAPKRIVSLSPTATEMLFAIGAGPRVVAVDDQSNYPAKAPRTKLSGFRPSAEAVAKYRPDLVVLMSDSNRVVASLRALHIRVLVQAAAPTLGAAYAQIRELGTATGRRPAANAVVTRMRTRIQGIVRDFPKPSTPLTYFHELSPDLYTATSKTFVGQVYGLLGLRNVADAADETGSGYPQLNAEFLIASNPDVVFLADTKCCAQTAATVAARAGWSNTNAVRNGRVIALNDDIASRWGPRVVTFLATVASRLRASGVQG